MANLKTILSGKHLLALSLALNASLVLRMGYDRGNKEGSCLKKTEHEVDSDTDKRVNSRSARLAVPSYSSRTNHPQDRDRVINLDYGDPSMYERYWREMGEKTTITIPGWQSMSYFSGWSDVCWFLEAEFATEVVRLHNAVGNAVTHGTHIVVGTGSSHLIMAALYALSPPHPPHQPIPVVSATPYYSSYPAMVDLQRSGLYKWGGSAESFEEEGPYIELVTSPNNPDGSERRSLINRSHGLQIHDLAYYWPQYTPISSPAHHHVTLFSLSKCTGHAGTRIGWALVRDREVAMKMSKFIEVSTIGVSKDSQLRAARILRAVSESCQGQRGESFFGFSHNVMDRRWKQLRAVVARSGMFSLPRFSPSFCNFSRRVVEPRPAFAWLKCEGDVEDCETFLREHKIKGRSGRHFGASPKYVRLSMLDSDENFTLFLDRLCSIQS
ncbi:tryptophan aminotransferase-related protein 2-like [Neltuma alba]|uniref:tryptophan aminotransferase-related protein 2-like n=1 Tax=Neltuma alba TaxID=207710 RepID=UPI0010A3DA94|nr:tryptophan aminotransferase-related protein 2-like [Prosopis alba]